MLFFCLSLLPFLFCVNFVLIYLFFSALLLFKYLDNVFWRHYMIWNKLKQSMLNIMSPEQLKSAYGKLFLFSCINKITLKTKMLLLSYNLSFFLVCFTFLFLFVSLNHWHSIHCINFRKKQNNNIIIIIAWYKLCIVCIVSQRFALLGLEIINDKFCFRWKTIHIR